MQTPPGNPLHFATLTYNAAGPEGITLNPHKQLTAAHLNEYIPGADDTAPKIREHIINTHKTLAPLFHIPDEHPALDWPFYLDPITKQPSHSMDIIKVIGMIPQKSCSEGFTLNILSRLPPAWAILAN